MIDPTPIEPGCLIHCQTNNEWDEVWDYIYKKYKNRPGLPHFPGPSACVRVQFNSGLLHYHGWDIEENYDRNPIFNDYIRVDFQGLVEIKTDIDDVMQSFDALLGGGSGA